MADRSLGPSHEHPIVIPPVGLEGMLRMPDEARAIIVFAHGSGSSRFSPRNRAVADALVERGLATLLFDLLTEAEAQDRANVFDIDLLASRLEAAIDLLSTYAETRDLPIGLFGASTGAAAALVAAAHRPERVAAVVSRGGRPDLAGAALPEVRAPTQLVVGGADTDVLDLNRQAQARLSAPNTLDIVAGATHLFEEPGTLDEVARLAGDWFLQHAGR